MMIAMTNTCLTIKFKVTLCNLQYIIMKCCNFNRSRKLVTFSSYVQIQAGYFQC